MSSKNRIFNSIVIVALILSLAPLALPSQVVLAVSPNIVISQVYGGGGNSGGIYTTDFVELFNRGTTTVSVAGWSIQYTSATGTGNFGSATNLITPLSGSLAPGQYLLVQEAAGANVIAPLPTPDVTDATPINMSATGGKVALVNTTTPLGCNGVANTCTPAALATIVDLVGWDGANYYETTGVAGTGPAPATTNSTAVLRKLDGAQDTDNNGADFVAGAPNPRNSQFPFGASGLATPATIVPGQTTLLTVAVIPGTNPASTGISVSCNLSLIGGSTAQALYDDGSNGDQVVGDNIFSFATIVTTPGTQLLSCTFSDAQGRSGTTPITLNVVSVIPIGTVNGPVLDTENGTTHMSPYLGQTVTVQGVIYEKTLQAINNSTNTYKGFYLQNTSTTADGDPHTSDGIFVFMNTSSTLAGPGGSTYIPSVGDEVIIAANVTEYFNMTELQAPNLSVLQVVRSGVDIEAEVPPVVANPPVGLADANRYWERLQGMRVQIPQNSVVLGGRNVFSPADAEIWLARPDSAIAQRDNLYARKAFRDAHLLDDNYDAANWDGNGYRMLIGSLGIKSAAGDAQTLIAPARAYSTLNDAPVGGVNYTFNKYRIEIDSQPIFSEGVDPAANNPPTVFDRSIHYSIADYNLENLYDYRDNPFSGCDFAGNSGCAKVDPFLSAVTPPYDYVPASDAVYQARLNDIALEIINDLHSPDILMVQEVENQDICSVTDGALTCGTTDNADGRPDVLQELALKIAANGGPAYDAAFDRDSSDLRGIAPSFLYRTDRVELRPAAGDPVLGGTPVIDGYTSVPYDSDVSNPKTLNAVLPVGVTACETSWVFPRAPDVGLFRIYSTALGVGSYRDVYVIDNHFKSGPDTCVAHRTEQAKYNAALVAYIQAVNPNARIVLGGDLNVYPRPDDPFAPIGQPASSDQLGSLYNPSLGLKNLWEVLLGQVPESAYSYVYLGMAQTLDQIFVNPTMLADLQQYRFAHINSDFPADYPGDVARGTSDHDPSVATFVINDPPIVDAGGPYAVDEGHSVTLTATGTDPEGQLLAYAWDLDNNGTFETPGQSVSFAGVDGPAVPIVKVQVTDNGGLISVASTTVTVNNVAPTITSLTNSGPINEGSSATITASATDPAGSNDPLTYEFDCNNDLTYETPTGSCAFDDNGAYTVNVRVSDGDGGIATGSTTVAVNNVAPTATFNAPSSVNEGDAFSLSLTNPVDVPADLGSLRYAFDCGSGYGVFSASSTASCPTVDNGTLNVGGKVMDKDGGVSEYVATVTINNVVPTVNTPVVSPEPSTEGSSVTASATFSDPGVNDAPFTCTVNYGDGSGGMPATISGNTCTSPAHVYLTLGAYTVTISVTDKDGGTGSNATTHVVIFNFSGFFRPVDNPPALNVVKAGWIIPVRFSLSGYRGLNIFATGYPQTSGITCNSSAQQVNVDETIAAGPSLLLYNPFTDRYIYVWKTDKTWAGTCRQLVVKLIDGTEHKANFRFK